MQELRTIWPLRIPSVLSLERDDGILYERVPKGAQTTPSWTKEKGAHVGISGRREKQLFGPKRLRTVQ